VTKASLQESSLASVSCCESSLHNCHDEGEESLMNTTPNTEDDDFRLKTVPSNKSTTSAQEIAPESRGCSSTSEEFSKTHHSFKQRFASLVTDYKAPEWTEAILFEDGESEISTLISYPTHAQYREAYYFDPLQDGTFF